MRWKEGSIVLFTVLAAHGIMQMGFATSTAAQAPKPTAAGVPTFEVDPFWPKALPNNYILGQVGGVFVDPQDHVWIVSRPRTLTKDQIGASLNPPAAECCVPAPPVIEFDATGNYMKGWGGPSDAYEWPNNEHSVFVDYKGNVWIGGNTASKDAQILKFTNDGKFLLQIGHAGKSQGSLDNENLNRPAEIYVYQKTNEVFVADGYGNRRVIVFDADTGAYKRSWGAYGNKPDDSAPRQRTYDGPGPAQFNTVHGVRISHDDLVYVSDRSNNRIQVFTPAGKFIREAFIARGTLDSRGTAFQVVFSPDKDQKFIYVPDGSNDRVRILDRETLQVVGSFGRNGPYAGQWDWLHSIGVDSKGNLYTGESRGNRVQKFVFKGLSAKSNE
jgi:DNA-binding beta-propeller fold protein YncE